MKHSLLKHNYVIGDSEQADLNVLISRCKTNVLDFNEDLLRMAFNFCVVAHEGRLAVTGKKFYTHPLAVAHIIVKEIPLDMEAVAAALLHNVVDESDVYSFDDIRFTFGDSIASIVEAVARIRLVETQHGRRADQIDNYRKLLLTLFKDIRIILVKLADELDNMRHLAYFSTYNQKQMAQQIFDIYVPFANRFGLTRLKFEMEDLAFQCLDPEIYNEINSTLSGTHFERTQYVDEFKVPIEERLEQEGLLKTNGIKYRINGRAKNIYSIYNKTQLRDKTVKELYDIFAIRIILETDNPLFCYYVYGIVGSLYKPIPETFKDYISAPKDNGYKSLHTAVAGPGDRIVEVQIRTETMHQAAEFGVAAHFRYKSSGVTQNSILEDQNIQEWLDDVRNVFEQIGKEDSQKLLSLILTNKLDNKIYVFTPKDEFKELPTSASVLDFAFAIHSQLGIRCLGAKVNGKFRPVNHILSSGDKVEVLVSNNEEAKNEWLNYVITSTATGALMRYLDRKNKAFIKKGKFAWAAKNQAAGFNLADDEIERVFRLYGFDSSNEFYYALGIGHIDVDNVYQMVMLELASSLQSDIETKAGRRRRWQRAEQMALIPNALTKRIIPLYRPLQDYQGKQFHFSDCCQPLPGDTIYGIAGRQHEIAVHNNKCLRYRKLQPTCPMDVVSLEWEHFSHVGFTAKLKIMAERLGNTASLICAAIDSSNDGQILDVRLATPSRHVIIVRVQFRMPVDGSIQRVISSVQSVPGVRLVERVGSRYDWAPVNAWPELLTMPG